MLFLLTATFPRHTYGSQYLADTGVSIRLFPMVVISISNAGILYIV